MKAIAEITRGKRKGEQIEFFINNKSAMAKIDALVSNLDSSKGIEGLKIIEVK